MPPREEYEGKMESLGNDRSLHLAAVISGHEPLAVQGQYI